MALPVILSINDSQADLETVGGKGANLVRLFQAKLPVPDGFLITTSAYRTFVETNDLWPIIKECLAKARGLSSNASVRSKAEDLDSLADAEIAIRGSFAAGEVPDAIKKPLLSAYRELSNQYPQTGQRTPGMYAAPSHLSEARVAVAVRSSATAEDLPGLSFAGQQDTFLNVVGEEALLEAVRDCWSSLWTARAIGYRSHNNIPHDEVALGIVVQLMIPSDVSGILFTANPVNGRRTEMVIDASFGLGEALMSGLVEPDQYVVEAESSRILSKTIGAKALAIRSQAGGGTTTRHTCRVPENASGRQALPDDMIQELVGLGRQVKTLFDSPQDIEWAATHGKRHVCRHAERTPNEGQLCLLQSRPITTLYPIPDEWVQYPEESLMVLFSFGAVQGLLGPVTPLGQDTIKGIFAGAASLFGYKTSGAKPVTLDTQRVILSAGERLFVNITSLVRHPIGRKVSRRALDLVEPSVAQAMLTLWGDPRLAPAPGWFKVKTLLRLLRFFIPAFGRMALTLLRPEEQRRKTDRQAKKYVTSLEERFKAVQSLKERLALFDELTRTGFPTVIPAYLPLVAGGMASLNLLRRISAGLNDAPDVLELTRGIQNNVTTEMDLALWDVAKSIKFDPNAAALFKDNEASALSAIYLAGQLPASATIAIGQFLKRYGMRGTGEIDIGRPRWREDPTPVMEVVQSYLHIEDPDQAPDVLFARGAKSAQAAENQLVAATRKTRGGWIKAHLIRFAAARLRSLLGARESPKFQLIRLLGTAREALFESGRDLVKIGTLSQASDIFFLRRSELAELAMGTERDWTALVTKRRTTFEREMTRRQIPRLLLSDGQAFYEGLDATAEAGEGILVGSPVSPGVVEGFVRIVFDPSGAQLSPGEILVCPGTDPAWTPLFLAAGGLVMEVGGLMTHGSVVAREYGIPAVVGVHQATSRLKNGQPIRVDGTNGRIEILSVRS
jgi:pyruvate,water dikinase